ncbi:MAG: hypothetical protein JNL28_15455 [Planctomycetes bacterium]|nr:hypothetical protein [Planctomycetota bacterium]
MIARILSIGLSLGLVFTAAACSGGGNDDGQRSFTNFVSGLAATPVDNAEPVAIDGLDFRFSEDPNAFNALFQ